MPRISRTKIVEEDEEVLEIGRGLLRKLFALTTEDALKFLARRKCIHNERACSKCHKPMGLVKTKDRTDSFKWNCSKCGNLEMSIRDESIFAKSKLPITTLLLITYVWSTNWGNNTFIEEELGLSPHAAVDWMRFCREKCQEYVDMMPKIGGPNRPPVQMDQMAVTKQKYHRGKPKESLNFWFQTFTEEGVGGLCTVRLMEDRTSDSIDALVMSHLHEGTVLVSDEWPAHKNLKERLKQKYDWNLAEHRMIKHKEGFSKVVEQPDGTKININTNKQEGLHTHLKKQMKYMLGTSVNYVEGYVAAAVFKLNCKACLLETFDAFLDLLVL
jgi:hypothetical protein